MAMNNKNEAIPMDSGITTKQMRAKQRIKPRREEFTIITLWCTTLMSQGRLIIINTSKDILT